MIITDDIVISLVFLMELYSHDRDCNINVTRLLKVV